MPFPTAYPAADPPPLPANDHFLVFGKPAIVDALPEPSERPLFSEQPGDVRGIKSQLRALNRELLFGYIELLSLLTTRPSGYARQLEAVGRVLRDMMALVGQLRPHQAR